MSARRTQTKNQLLDEASQIEREEVRSIGEIGCMARVLAQATLPHSDPQLPAGTLYTRDTGCFTLTVAPTSKRHGIPYGTVPRLILAWICTEFARTKERTLSLGRSQAAFLKRLEMHNNGRDIGRFREQALRLFKSVISVEYPDDGGRDGDSERLMISDSSHVFWHPKQLAQDALWDSSIDLSERFCKELLAAPVPIDLHVYHRLSKAPLAMDIYTWLTYRMFVLRRSGKTFAFVPWVGLLAQLGAGYPFTPKGVANFRTKFCVRLRAVLDYYPEARNHIDVSHKEYLRLTPCKLHISQVRRLGE